ncbi:MAG: hypothetical protein R3E79_58700 [Caldilineaceae bacterium]
MTTSIHKPTQQSSTSNPLPNGSSDGDANGDQHPIEDRYNTHDASFRRHYQLNYHDNAHDYEMFYAPAYRFGYELGEESAATKWEDVEAEAQRHWQANHPSAWHEIADAVRYGWTEQRNPEMLRVHHNDDFETYRAGFERHYLEMAADDDSLFEHYAPAYLYGYTLAIDPNYQTQEWTDMEPEVRRYYETEYANGELPWERYRNAAQHAWDRARPTNL